MGLQVPVFKPKESHCCPLDRGLARRKLQLHGFCFARAVYQMPLDYGAEMHLQTVVMHVSFDSGARLEFEEFGHIHGPRDLAIHDQVRYADFPFYTGFFAQYQGRRLVGNRSYVSDDFSVDTKASGKIDITLDLRADTNQAVDAVLRLAGLLAKHSASHLLRKVDVLAGTGLAGPVLQDTRLYGPHPGSCRNPKCSLNSTKILEVEPKSSAPCLGRLGNDDCSIPALLLHLHHELQRPVKLAVKPAPLEDEQPVAKLAGQDVALDFEAVDTDFLAASLARDEIFEKSKIFLEPVVLVLERLHLRSKLGLRGLLDLQARLTGVGDRAQPRSLALEPTHRFAKPGEFVLQLAAIETGETTPRVVHPRRQGKREREEHQHSKPAPVPSDVRLDRHLRRRNPKALAELFEEFGHRILRRRVRAQWPDARDPSSPRIRTLYSYSVPLVPKRLSPDCRSLRVRRAYLPHSGDGSRCGRCWWPAPSAYPVRFRQGAHRRRARCGSDLRTASETRS